jgi:hypothetical protein
MANQQIAEYIQQAIQSGMDKDSIKKSLLQSGWPENIVNEELMPQDHIPVPQPTAAPMIPQAMYTSPQTEHSKKRIFTLAGIVLLVVILLGGGAYAYVMKLGPFSRPPYTEKNLLTGLLGSIAKIDTSSYSASASVSINPREAGAVPFTIDASSQTAHRKEYQYDVQRINDISRIVQALQSYTYENDKTVYPASLDVMAAQQKNTSYYYNRFSLKDPETGRAYQYTRTENGKNYSLTFTLNTNEAISQLKNSYYTRDEIRITNKTITLTKDISYIYISSELPKPLLLQLSEAMAQLPQDMKVSFSAGAVTDWRKEDADWKFNMDATGDFGDLSYKVNADALKKSSTYYFRINNVPSLFLMVVGNIAKGSWYKIDTNTASSSSSDSYNSNGLSSLAQEIPKAEKSYKAARKDLTEFIRNAAELADQEQLFTFKKSPYSETIDNRTLYHYELGIKRAAIVPFYEKLLKKIDAMNLKSDFTSLADEAYLEYLKSKDFEDIFDYYDKNTSLAVWVDSDGYPALIEYKMRIVPQDTAEQFKNKQLDLVWKLSIADINKSVDIKAPENAKNIADLTDQGALGEARMKARDARRIADVRQIQLALELYADANDQQYPTRLADLTTKYIPTVPTDPSTKSVYRYTYSTVKGKRTLYHLGASLEKETNNGLLGDADSTTGFDGGDSKGCSGETGRYCYDVTP